MNTRKRISVIFLVIASIAGLIAPSANAAATRYITVSAQGTIKVTPDAVRLNATVSAVAATSKDALAAANKTATAVRAALKAAKIDTKDISIAQLLRSIQNKNTQTMELRHRLAFADRNHLPSLSGLQIQQVQ
jgi:uncharacterized protein YggE